MTRSQAVTQFRAQRFIPYVLGALLSAFIGGAVSPVNATAVCSNTANYTRTKTVKGSHYMIAAAHPLATEAGCEVLEAGGTAIDAAIATQMVLAVVEPQASGLAGGTLITYWDNTAQRVRHFEGLARSPQAVTADLRTPTLQEQYDCSPDPLVPIDRFLGRVSNTARAFGVPGTLKVLEMVHKIYNTTEQVQKEKWQALFADAIRIADDGFPMPEYLHTVLGETAVAGIPRCKFPDIQARYCLNESTPKPLGTILYNHELADTLRKVRDGGADAFYNPTGEIAPHIIARATAGACTYNSEPAVIPSLMTVDDIHAYEAKERNPVCDDVLGRIICSAAPPAFGGTAMLYMLNLMERGAFETASYKSLANTHLFIEASRLAQIDRRNYIGDPDFNPIPVVTLQDNVDLLNNSGLLHATGLLNSAYLDSRFDLISPDQAIDPVTWGVPPGAEALPWTQGTQEDTGGDMTSQVSIVDQYGNALSMTTTINSTFGAHIEAKGMLLNNVQNNFTRLDSISPGVPVNVMQPTKRPRTAMAPTLVFDSQGRVEFVVGAAGGSAIPDYLAQTIQAVFLYGKNGQTAIRRAHMSGQWITSNNGIRQLRSELESGTSVAAWLDELQAMGHPAARSTMLRSGLAAIQLKYKANGTVRLFGAADPRRDGVAMGN